MGILSNCSFVLGPPNGWKFREKYQNNSSKCFLCGEVLSKRRPLISKKKLGKLNFVIRACYDGRKSNGNDDKGMHGERENKENSNLATMASSEKKSDDSSDSSPASISSGVQERFSNQLEKVDATDVKVIKEKLFGYSTFWVTREEPFGDLGEGILFLGNIRGKREDVFAKLQSQLSEIMGDKYNLFMVEEPNSEGEDPRGGPRVSFGLLRKEVSEPEQTTLWQYVIAFLLFLLTIGSSVELGIASQINRLPPEIVKYFTDPDAIEPPDMQLLFPFVDSALPLAYGVLGIQLFHVSNIFSPWKLDIFLLHFREMKLSIPYFIPNITLGSFGAITQGQSDIAHVFPLLESIQVFLPDRKAKVDISLAGPFAGAALSFSMFAVGLLLSSNPDVAGDFVQVPSTLFQGSLFLGLISRAVLGYKAMHAATVSIHPLVIAGWCGLTTSAFNLLPVGCLDGGRAIQGAFGKNTLIASGLATYTLLGLGVLGGPLSLPWGLYVLICQRDPEKPCLNDVTEVGTWRKAVVTVAIVLVVLTLLPVWDELAEELD
ncbi:putative zinc metalloprotease EGY1, chloroplastic [Sesamum angolense]|uniref:Zinc metalloprotease EGY1, chloroplastic n=1 Tax=Sesamum angolense TaxID=2727404 RepID=A0AAE1WG51_9LAMI|nr:putative zinc metalloprotease EGY1, chloroplastic [Sesamum angolense]